MFINLSFPKNEFVSRVCCLITFCVVQFYELFRDVIVQYYFKYKHYMEAPDFSPLIQFPVMICFTNINAIKLFPFR
jgi:hypothetical protein